MLKKYEHLIKERQIALLLAVAVTYYSLHKDITNAAEYFLKALIMDPRNNKFKVYIKIYIVSYICIYNVKKRTQIVIG